MNADDRFDQLIRASLEWQADEAVRRAPPLDLSMRRLAERLGPDRLRVQPVVLARPETARTLHVLLAVVLLVALLIAALAIGSRLTRMPGPRIGPTGATGSLAAARGAGHTTIALPDGRALVAFGWAGFAPVASVELWDPVSGTFRDAGSLAEARNRATATLLADGRVLIVGGFGGPYEYPGHALTSAELWDPLSASFTPAGSMAVKRAGHTATLLTDGRVLIVGGTSEKTAELWDPAGRTFRPAGTLAAAHAGHVATLLRDGRVLIVGGASAEFWDPGSGAFSPAGSLDEPRTDAVAALLPDGRVLVVGGRPYPAPDESGGLTDDGRVRVSGSDGRPPHRLGSAELWDPKAREFSPTGWLAEGRVGHTVTAMPDGRIVVLGGEGIVVEEGHSYRVVRASAEVRDPADGSFSHGPPLLAERSGHAATLLADGRILVVGGEGQGGAGDFLRSAELYHPDAPAQTQPSPRP